MICYDCQNNRKTYIHDCLGCNVRMVKSARPSRKKQEAMLTYLTRYGKFTREQILEAMKNDSDTTAT